MYDSSRKKSAKNLNAKHQYSQYANSEAHHLGASLEVKNKAESKKQAIAH